MPNLITNFLFSRETRFRFPTGSVIVFARLPGEEVSVAFVFGVLPQMLYDGLNSPEALFKIN